MPEIFLLDTVFDYRVYNIISAKFKGINYILKNEVTIMNNKRKVEIFSAGCQCCNEAVEMVKEIACPSCDVEVLDMRDESVAEKAKKYGVKSVPAVAVDGQLASCCAGRGVDEATLRSAGLGVPLS